MSETKSDPRARIFGQTAHRDLEAGFSFWRPKNWNSAEIQDPGALDPRALEPRAPAQRAHVYYPEEDPRTGFYLLHRSFGPELGEPFSAADLPDLREGLLEGLQGLPEFHLLSEVEIGRESAVGLEFSFTFLLDDQPCKRCMRFLYRGRQQIILYGQGVPLSEYDVFCNVFDWIYLTFTFGDVVENLAALHTLPAPDQ